MKPIPLMLVLLVTAMALAARAPGNEAAGSPDAGSLASRGSAIQDPDIPEAVSEATRQGRYWRASRILGDHLAAVADTAPETILLASRLSAGWGNWSGVIRLLDGRPWLDEVDGGTGWALLGRSRIELGEPRAGSEALSRYLSVAETGDRDSALARIRRALALADDGRAEAAVAALDSAAEEVPWFADWIDILAAEVLAPTGDTAAVRERLTAVDPALENGRGWRLRMTAAREVGDTEAGRRIALEAARNASSDSERAAAWVELADLRLQAGDSARAREAYRSAIEASPGTTAGVDGARALSRMNPTPEEWRRIGLIYRRHGNQDRAIDGLRRFLDSGVGEPGERANVRLQLGRAYFGAGRYRQAESTLSELADDEVAPRIAAEALYWTARARYRQGRSGDGQATFVELGRRFPDQPATARGLYLLADLKHDDLEIAEARQYYRQAVDAGPDLNEAGLAMMRLGGLHYLDGDYQEAAGVFEEYRTRYPTGRRISQATYWAARAYQELGREAEAGTLLEAIRQDDPVSYYGMRAAELLGTSVLDLPMEPSPPRVAAMDSAVEAALRRVDLLADLEKRGDLVLEVERLRGHFERRDGGDYTLAEALADRGYTLTAIGMGWTIREREGAWNPRLLRIVYPFPFRELVLPEARERGVDPFLVAGLIRRESAFSPSVVSPAGAIGLMQIMPRTGSGLAQGAGVRDYSPDLLKEPEINVHLGIRYLEELLGRFGEDNLPLTLSAYNAGPNRAVRWREMPEHRDRELFTERIPYNETRNYVRFVLLHRALYEALYAGAATGDAP